MSCITAPKEGRILYDGAPFERKNLAVGKRKHFTQDTPTLFYEQSVATSIATFLHLYDAPLEGRDESMAQWLDKTGAARAC